MTVAELIKLLQKVDQDRLVVMSIDSEGNNFSLLDEIGESSYEAGETYLEELTPELIEQGYGEEDVRSDAPKAIVLWPV